MKRSITFIFVIGLILGTFAASWVQIPVTGVNNCIYRTCRIDSAFAGQTRFTPWFALADQENPVVQFRFNDTTHLGYRGDSIVCYAFLQRGHPSITSSYAPTTQPTLSPKLIDTINALDTANWKSRTVIADNDSDIAKGLDSTGTSGYGVMSKGLKDLYRSPYGRIGITFTVGTKQGATKAALFWVDLIQTKYWKTDLYPRERPDPQ